MAWEMTSTKPDAAFVCVEAVVDASIGASDLLDAASILEEYVARVPHQISALLRLVEVCVDGGLEGAMFEAQAQLADAYLAAGQAAEARVIAEDLVTREPWDQTHIDRFRQSLVMLNVEDPDTVIAERLSGQGQFAGSDHFAETLSSTESIPEPDTALVQDVEEEPAPLLSAAATFEDFPESFSVTPEEPLAFDEPDDVIQPPERRPASGRSLGSMEIDLASVLAEFESSESAPVMRTAPPREDLEEVFQDFRDEVTRQVGADDAAQHLTLANTYLEMGMEDDAIASLKTAARSPRHRFEAGTHLARLFKGRNDMTQAVEWMERAAEAPAPSADAGLALLYDLGATLEGMGETARALAVFMELQADAGEYRDVNDRVERLSRVQTGG
jgi:tetratricopeptide (TPR) repeat protein